MKQEALDRATLKISFDEATDISLERLRSAMTVERDFSTFYLGFCSFRMRGK